LRLGCGLTAKLPFLVLPMLASGSMRRRAGRFDLQALHDEYRNEPGTVIEADFYHANQFLPLSDEEIVRIVQLAAVFRFGKRR